jgi:predicted TIM-barrel enzyme
MNISPVIHDLVHCLFALEANHVKLSDTRIDEAVRVCEKLRVVLSKQVGTLGFSALLSRALTLAKTDAPILQGLRVGADGTLEGLESVEQYRDMKMSIRGGGEVLVAQLLELLANIIGESLTLGMVYSIWPAAKTKRSEEKNL